MKKMSKAVLVFDMPRSCIECPCLHINPSTRNCGAMEEFCIPSAEEVFDKKPDWCPLKEVIEGTYDGIII